MDYRRSDAHFKNGFAAGVYDTISVFTAAAEESGSIDSTTTLGLFRCLASQGDKLGQLRAWIDSTVGAALSGDYPAVWAVIRGCRLSFQGAPTYWEAVGDYPSDTELFRDGFTAGVADTASLLAMIAQHTGGIDSQKAATLLQCLTSRGNKLGQFVTWVDTATAGASPNDAAVEVIVRVCLP